MKRIVFILSIILLTVTISHAQARVSQMAAAVPIVRLFPNPATSFVTFDFDKDFQKGLSIQVYNFLGKKMYESANINQRTTINLSDYTRGVYVYQIRDHSGKMIESGKFQVSK
ncbi:MAG: T9SS type A sorting domain-containing protein [Chitinophagaceae bacterium]|nr:T9SS type A sorting domain-containing protein [Chitinophagaceae bacterium]